jgi:hypothetical protein
LAFHITTLLMHACLRQLNGPLQQLQFFWFLFPIWFYQAYKYLCGSERGRENTHATTKTNYVMHSPPHSFSRYFSFGFSHHHTTNACMVVREGERTHALPREPMDSFINKNGRYPLFSTKPARLGFIGRSVFGKENQFFLKKLQKSKNQMLNRLRGQNRSVSQKNER